MEKMTMDKLVNFCKQYGFIFQGSEIYGGLANTWDFGPVGSLLKDNVKKAVGDFQMKKAKIKEMYEGIYQDEYDKIASEYAKSKK